MNAHCEEWDEAGMENCTIWLPNTKAYNNLFRTFFRLKKRDAHTFMDRNLIPKSNHTFYVLPLEDIPIQIKRSNSIHYSRREKPNVV